MEPLGSLTIDLRGAAYGEALAEADLPEGRLVAVALGADLEVAPAERFTTSFHPAERALFESLPARRARTWVGGRMALRRALVETPALPMLADDRGAPSLPDGWAGSIAHKDPIAVALAARTGERRVGVDVEIVSKPTSLRLTSKILRPDEAALLAGDDDARARALLLAFCAKEAIYKAIDPFVRRYVGFHEVRLRGDPSRYQVEPLLKTGERLHVEARAFVAGDVVVAIATASR